jgi:hypothetical protein
MDMIRDPWVLDVEILSVSDNISSPNRSTEFTVDIKELDFISLPGAGTADDDTAEPRIVCVWTCLTNDGTVNGRVDRFGRTGHDVEAMMRSVAAPGAVLP